jgi:hypothetical protein
MQLNPFPAGSGKDIQAGFFGAPGSACGGARAAAKVAGVHGKPSAASRAREGRVDDDGDHAAPAAARARQHVGGEHGARSLSLLTVSDPIVTGEHTPPDERERGFGQMAALARELAAELASGAP